MAFEFKWDHDGDKGLQYQHAAGFIVLVAFLFLIAVRHGFRPID